MLNIYNRALFKVSTNLSACPFDLGWYCGAVMCFTRYVSQNCLNSLDVNCVALSVTMFVHGGKKMNCPRIGPDYFIILVTTARKLLLAKLSQLHQVIPNIEI